MYLPRNVAVLVCVVLPFVLCVSGQGTKTTTIHKSDCESQKTCAKCISTPSCKWCSEKRPLSSDVKSKSNVTALPRCVNIHATYANWCPSKDVINPSSKITIIDDHDFSMVMDNQIQLKPQRLSMDLRVGQEQMVQIEYKQALGYPVDLYFLMDLSFSMEKHRNKLSKLGNKLSDAMQNITSNFRLGFGSFVDKYILPMTSRQPEWLNNYCKLRDGTVCAEPYDYKHQMTLTDDIAAFKDQVEAAPISGNIDSPEGGFDALMQAMVCEERIGWRKKARHIIVYSSDATYHIAGDGRLAGIIEPNDEQCHLDEKGFYDHAEKLDYPSVSQIRKIARDNSKNIIFAVTSTVAQEYKELSEVIDGSACGTLIGDSENVVNLVKSHTEKLTQSIKMSARADKMFEIKYSSQPIVANPNVQCAKDTCSGISDKTPIRFDVSIKALQCPELKENRNQKIEIELEGIPEKVTIDVNLICECTDCSRTSIAEECSGRGDLVCGVCECHPGFEHDDCGCMVNNTASGDVRGCQNPETNMTCSGHGKCNSCGICSECDDGPSKAAGDKYYGEWCECDNFSCPRTNNIPCGGPSRGQCVCGGTCQCNEGWEGVGCGCRTPDSCIQPGGNGEVCGGFGDCVCGMCQCTKDDRRSGKYCEECLTCASLLCDQYKDCVECFAYQSGPEYVEGEDCPRCHDIVLDGKVERINETENGTAVCHIPDSAGCTFAFSYSKARGDEEKVFAVAENEKKCTPALISPWGLAGSAIGLTLFLGLLGLILWKVLTMFHDHREWVKFEKERVSANWERGDNPLFKEPTTSFNNPTFDSQTTK